MQVLTGTLKRYQQMSADLLGDGNGGKDGEKAEGGEKGSSGEGGESGVGGSGMRLLQLKALNELCFGSLEGLPGGKLRHSFPEEYEARAIDPLNYRYPGVGGQGYMDLITDLRDVVLTLERMQVLCPASVFATFHRTHHPAVLTPARVPMRPCAHAPMRPCAHAPMHPCTHAPMHPCTHGSRMWP